MQPGNRYRLLRYLLAGIALALGIFTLAGADYARRGIDHIVHLVATSRVEDWSTHLVEKHHDLVRNIARRPMSRQDVADLRREAEIYGVEAFRIEPAHEPLGKVRMYARNTFEEPHDKIARLAFAPATATASAGLALVDGSASAAQQHEEPEGMARVRLPLKDADGNMLGYITAVVDQKRLHAELTEAMQRIFVSAIIALVIIAAMALLLFRRLQTDAQNRITYAREFDDLTGLPNHVAFEQLLDEYLAQPVGDPPRRALACIIFGVDDLGRITCAEGHEAASHVLRTLAGRFSRLAHRHGATVFRLRRDDFAVLLPLPWPGRDEAHAFMQELLHEAQRPLYWHGKSLILTLSVGISFHPQEQATSRSELTRQATLMRQAARDAGGNTFHIYDSAMDRDYNEMAELERLVRRAARNCARYFSLHYQPIVRLEDEHLHGFEVLLRMHDDDGKPISPAKFIPIAERLNLMNEIGAFVLAEACSTAVKWPQHLKISVNLSPTQFASGQLIATLWKALETSGLDPQRLELEVTESLMMQDWDKARTQLEEARKRGVSIVLDDFGTGYSSMSYLWKFSFDKLKIDRSFTQAVNSCGEARSILRALVIMARSLRMPVVVEGVETLEQAVFLRKFRCDFAQGYYYGKPMPPHEVAAVIMRDFQRRQAMQQEEADRSNTAHTSAAL